MGDQALYPFTETHPKKDDDDVSSLAASPHFNIGGKREKTITLVIPPLSGFAPGFSENNRKFGRVQLFPMHSNRGFLFSRISGLSKK
jgi:hypothetical protein